MFNFSQDAQTNPIETDQRGAVEAFLRSVRILSLWLTWIEFTRNAIQAAIDGENNLVKWFLAPRRGGGLNWGILDNGVGMNSHGMVNMLGKLRRSTVVSVASALASLVGKRHGIGARMTALRASPGGTTWTSLHDGMVNTAKLWLDENDLNDPVKITHERPMSLQEYEAAHPEWPVREEIIQAGHGTQVIFDDFMAVEKASQSTLTESEKLVHLLSRRWFGPIPSVIKVEALREKRGEHWGMTVVPIGGALDGSGERLPSVEVSQGVLVHAWLLPEDSSSLNDKFDAANIFDARKPKASFGLMQSGEIYKLLRGGNAYNKLRSWGVTHGADRVTLIVELSEQHFQPNDDRSQLLPVGGTDRQGDDDLRDKEWGIKYSESMPTRLKEYIRSIMLGSEKDRYDKLKEWQLARIIPSTGGGNDTRRTCKRCGLPYSDCKCDRQERVCPSCNKPLSECECEKKPKSKKPGTDPTPGAFWPRTIEWEEMPEGSAPPCQYTQIRGGELYMNLSYKHYKRLVSLLESTRYGFDHEVAEKTAQQVYVSVAVDVIAGAINNRKPDPEQRQFEDTLVLPHLIACKIEDVVALHGFTANVVEIGEGG